MLSETVWGVTLSEAAKHPHMREVRVQHAVLKAKVNRTHM